jgi:hypothetical protein
MVVIDNSINKETEALIDTDLIFNDIFINVDNIIIKIL